MFISLLVKVFLGCLIGFYLVFNGWMAIKNKRIFIPLNIKLGLWLAGKIYGDNFAEKERGKFIKNQISQGQQMLFVGLIVIFVSLLPLFK